MTSAPRFALSALLAAALLGWPRFCAAAESSETAAPDGDPSARQPALLLECRGEATVQRTCDRLGLPIQGAWPAEEPAIADFHRARDVSALSIAYSDRTAANIYALSPDDLADRLSLYASENWSRDPDTPDGF